MKLATETTAMFLRGATALSAGQGQKRTGRHAPQDATVGLPNLTVPSAHNQLRSVLQSLYQLHRLDLLTPR